MPRPRRVSTAPLAHPSPPPASTSSSTSAHSDDLVETLYSHPSVKIIAFTSTERTSFGARPSSPKDQPGTLPASSRLERTIAVGPFRIYRAPGSVAFLSCGSALQPILPKSQCWCIDEDNSRFVLQIRRPQYWRIELPVSEPDDQERALVLRDVLDKALLFEKTACPFQRSFEVELPDQLTPKKKAWTAEGKNLISSPFSSHPNTPESARLYGRDRQASLLADELGQFHFDGDFDPERFRFLHEHQEGLEGPEGLTGFEWRDSSARYQRLLGIAASRSDSVSPDFSTPERSSRSHAASADTHGNGDEAPQSPASNLAPVLETETATTSAVRDVGRGEIIDDEAVGEPSSFEGSGRVAPTNLKKKRMSRILAGRAYTAPSHLTVVTSPPSKSSKSSTSRDSPATTRPNLPPPSQSVAADANSPVESTDSFHSVQSWSSHNDPLPPSPPSSRPVTPNPSRFPPPHENIVVHRKSPREKDQVAHKSTPDTDRTFIPSSEGAADHTDGTASPVPRSPVEANDDHVSPVPVDRPLEVSYASAVEGTPQAQQRPRLRPHSLSMSRQALSPLPSAANFFTPPPRRTAQSRMQAVRRLPSAIIHKTVELLLSPPAYLINLMLKVAARIAAGEWRGLVFGFGEGGERIPVQWDYSDGEFSDWSGDEDYASAKQRQSNSSSSNSILGTGNRDPYDSAEVD